jgi:hypothetical protein
MKKFVFLSYFLVVVNYITFSQYSSKPVNPTYKYVADPGFVNISELNGAIGLSDTIGLNAKYYFGVSNVFGYQIDRNFFGGIGIGVYIYDEGQLIPLYLEYKYSHYLKNFTPYFYADGGALFSPTDFKSESKIFINPGIGISRAISPKFEGIFSVGFMVQSQSSLERVFFINFKAGITFRKNAFRMFKQGKTN